MHLKKLLIVYLPTQYFVLFIILYSILSRLLSCALWSAVLFCPLQWSVMCCVPLFCVGMLLGWRGLSCPVCQVWYPIILVSCTVLWYSVMCCCLLYCLVHRSVLLSGILSWSVRHIANDLVPLGVVLPQLPEPTEEGERSDPPPPPPPVRSDALPIALEISRRLRPHHKDARLLINILTAQKFLVCAAAGPTWLSFLVRAAAGPTQLSS